MDSFDWDTSKLPERWFDWSSTKQAVWHSSDCVLRPVKAIPDITRQDWRLVMCEVYNADGTPHESNSRFTIHNTTESMHDDTGNYWFGFEQEYVLARDWKPLWFPEDWYPAPQGKYYCWVGYSTMWDTARTIVEQHLDICLAAWINITCINAEVMKWQREFCVLSKGAEAAWDDLRLARYIMTRLCEHYWVDLVLHPKPVSWDRNGTGMHCNFSNKKMREEWWEEYFNAICKQFWKHVDEHIAVYGSDNHLRLTWEHETQSIDKFSYGISDRWASIRIPHATVSNNWKWRLEDRRVAANADPYKVVARVIKTLKEVE